MIRSGWSEATTTIFNGENSRIGGVFVRMAVSTTLRRTSSRRVVWVITKNLMAGLSVLNVASELRKRALLLRAATLYALVGATVDLLVCINE